MEPDVTANVGILSSVMKIINSSMPYIAVPVPNLLIFLYGCVLASKSRPNKMGFFMGLLIFTLVVLAHNLGTIPLYSSSASKFPLWEFLISLIFSVLVGFFFMKQLKRLLITPSAGFLVALLTGASLTSIYLYWTQEAIKSLLQVVAPSILMGGLAHEIVCFQSKVREKEN